jgi:predicted ATPase
MELKKLNVFTGLNGVGKTKLIENLRVSLPSQTLYFDKPENNLHPSLQSKWIKDLCTKTAQSDDMVFIETHGDHIIHGILISCKRYFEGEGGINPNEVAIFHLSDNQDPIHIPIVDRYYIEDEPDGFFTQFSDDLRILTSPIKKQKIVQIHVDTDGKIDKQPKGFFDQTEPDTTELMGF